MLGSLDAAYSIFSKPVKAIPWQTIIDLIMSLINGGCKPKNNRDSDALVTKWGKRCSSGVDGCCPANVRKQVMKLAGVDDAKVQDRAFYVVVHHVNNNRKLFVPVLSA